jgi:tRNA (guanine-N7-)-methyltransferase
MARMRRIHGVVEMLKEYPDLYITDPAEHRGHFRDLFAGEGPLHVEFGSGKGKFITEMAAAHPDVLYLAVDLIPEVIYKGVRRAADAGVTNARFLVMDIQHAEEIFEPGEIDRIYLNFSDPWPKNRHAKRRLTHEQFLVHYQRVLAADGWIHFKTDNRDFFEFSLNEFAKLDLKMRNISLDLHANEPIGNIRTRYEEKFSKRGQPIYRVEATFR